MKTRYLSLAMAATVLVTSAASARQYQDPDQIAADLFANSAEQGVRFNDPKNCLIFSDFMDEFSDQLSEQNYNRITFRLKRSNCDQPEPAPVIAPEPEPVTKPKFTIELNLGSTPVPVPNPVPASNLFRISNLGSYDSLSLRRSAPKGERLVKIPKGTINLPVQRCRAVQGSNRPWCYLTYNGISGWAYSKYLTSQLTGNAPNIGIYPAYEPPVEVMPEPDQPPQVNERYRVVGVERGDKLKVRNRPTGTIVGNVGRKARNINLSECVKIEDSSSPWCYVEHKGKVGWVYGKFLRGQITRERPREGFYDREAHAEPEPELTPLKHTYKVTGVKSRDWLNLRLSPVRGQIIARLAPTASGIELISCDPKGSKRHAWCLISVGNQEGWAYGKFLTSEIDGHSPE